MDKVSFILLLLIVCGIVSTNARWVCLNESFDTIDCDDDSTFTTLRDGSYLGTRFRSAKCIHDSTYDQKYIAPESACLSPPPPNSEAGLVYYDTPQSGSPEYPMLVDTYGSSTSWMLVPYTYCYNSRAYNSAFCQDHTNGAFTSSAFCSGVPQTEANCTSDCPTDVEWLLISSTCYGSCGKGLLKHEYVCRTTSTSELVSNDCCLGVRKPKEDGECDVEFLCSGYCADAVLRDGASYYNSNYCICPPGYFGYDNDRLCTKQARSNGDERLEVYLADTQEYKLVNITDFERFPLSDRPLDFRFTFSLASDATPDLASFGQIPISLLIERASEGNAPAQRLHLASHFSWVKQGVTVEMQFSMPNPPQFPFDVPFDIILRIGTASHTIGTSFFDKDDAICNPDNITGLDPNTGACICKPGFTGADCNTDACAHCLDDNTESCTNGVCQCKPGWGGSTCNAYIDCPRPINGIYLDPSCANVSCHSTFSSEDCSVCEPCASRNNGTINEESCTCECKPGFTGNGCHCEGITIQFDVLLDFTPSEEPEKAQAFINELELDLLRLAKTSFYELSLSLTQNSDSTYTVTYLLSEFCSLYSATAWPTFDVVPLQSQSDSNDILSSSSSRRYDLDRLFGSTMKGKLFTSSQSGMQSTLSTWSDSSMSVSTMHRLRSYIESNIHDNQAADIHELIASFYTDVLPTYTGQHSSGNSSEEAMPIFPLSSLPISHVITADGFTKGVGDAQDSVYMESHPRTASLQSNDTRQFQFTYNTTEDASAYLRFHPTPARAHLTYVISRANLLRSFLIGRHPVLAAYPSLAAIELWNGVSIIDHTCSSRDRNCATIGRNERRTRLGPDDQYDWMFDDDSSGGSSSLGLIIGLVAGGVVLLLVIGIICCCCLKGSNKEDKKRSKAEKKEEKKRKKQSEMEMKKTTYWQGPAQPEPVYTAPTAQSQYQQQQQQPHQPSYQPAPAPTPQYQPAPAPTPQYQPAPAPTPSPQYQPAPQQRGPPPGYQPTPTAQSRPPPPAYSPTSSPQGRAPPPSYTPSASAAPSLDTPTGFDQPRNPGYQPPVPGGGNDYYNVPVSGNNPYDY